MMIWFMTAVGTDIKTAVDIYFTLCLGCLVRECLVPIAISKLGPSALQIVHEIVEHF